MVLQVGILDCAQVVVRVQVVEQVQWAGCVWEQRRESVNGAVGART